MRFTLFAAAAAFAFAAHGAAKASELDAPRMQAAKAFATTLARVALDRSRASAAVVVARPGSEYLCSIDLDGGKRRATVVDPDPERACYLAIEHMRRNLGLLP